MLGSGAFYWGGFDKATTVFGTLFNDITIERQDDSGQTTQLVRVPITFGPREKYIEALRHPKAAQNAITLPHMSFDITGFEYAPTRKLISSQRIVFSEQVSQDKNAYTSMKNPVPYDIEFELTIYSKNESDCFKIVEQILPYFTPDFTPTIQILPDQTDLRADVPLTLTSHSKEDLYEGSFLERRAVLYRLGFVMQWYFFGPKSTAAIIKLANTNFHVDSFNNPVVSRVTITPGLTEDGLPTTDPDETIPYQQISAEDDWDYVIVKEDFPETAND